MTTTTVGNVQKQTGTLQASTDGGTTWTALGDDLGLIFDVKLGVDGRNLYVATEKGIWQHPMGNPAE